MGVVRQAVAQGFAARLIGEGTIDLDEDATLLAGIDELIRRSGEDAVARTSSGSSSGCSRAHRVRPCRFQSEVSRMSRSSFGVAEPVRPRK